LLFWTNKPKQECLEKKEGNLKRIGKYMENKRNKELNKCVFYKAKIFLLLISFGKISLKSSPLSIHKSKVGPQPDIFIRHQRLLNPKRSKARNLLQK